ncbi:Transporter of the ATP-binding cassette (ABC), partial [Coemansia sp. RSA 2673]
MAVDAHKVSEISAYLHFLYQLPAQMAIAVLMLYQLLGIASLAGVAAIAVLIPVQWRLVSVWNRYQNQLMKVSDRRMGMMNEILQGVRIIKFFAWEPQFERQVAGVRGSELAVLRNRYLALTYSILVFFMAPVFVTLATFVCYTKFLDHQLTASIAFTALALFKALRAPIDQLPDVISFCLQSKVSLDRVAKFLGEEETPNAEAALEPAGERQNELGAGTLPAGLQIPTIIETRPSEEPAATPSGATTTTTPGADSSEPSGSSRFELRDLTVSFPIGKLSIVAGPTGCGKSSMLMALLGEMRCVEGQLM